MPLQIARCAASVLFCSLHKNGQRLTINRICVHNTHLCSLENNQSDTSPLTHKCVLCFKRFFNNFTEIECEAESVNFSNVDLFNPWCWFSGVKTGTEIKYSHNNT